MYDHLALMVIPQPLAQQAREAYARLYLSSSITIIVIRIRRGTADLHLGFAISPETLRKSTVIQYRRCAEKGKLTFPQQGTFQSRCYIEGQQ